MTTISPFYVIIASLHAFCFAEFELPAEFVLSYKAKKPRAFNLQHIKKKYFTQNKGVAFW